MAIPSQGLGHPVSPPHSCPTPLHPSALLLGGFSEKRPRMTVFSPEVLSPHKGVRPLFLPWVLGGGCRAHAEAVGVRQDAGGLFPSAPHVHRSGGLLLPQMGKKASQRSWHHPACSEERRSHGSSSVERGVAQGGSLLQDGALAQARGHPSSKMAPCEPLFKEQQDLMGDQQPSAGRKGELWGTPAAMLPGREVG